jgi:hypothetical protein
VKKMTKTHDEWVSTGITYVMKAEETDEKAIFWLEKAMDCFELEKHPSLQDKIEAHHRAYTWKNSKSTEARWWTLGRGLVDSLVQSELEMEGVEILEQIIQQGLTVEALESAICLFHFGRLLTREFETKTRSTFAASRFIKLPDRLISVPRRSV